MNLAPHFTKAELQCPHCGLCLMQDRFLVALEALRTRWGRPLHINSGYRCKTHNSSLKDSSPNSQHLKGNAADIDIHKLTEEERLSFISMCREVFAGIGIAKPFIHVDLGSKREWTY